VALVANVGTPCVLALAALALTELACAPACDDGPLRRAAAAFQAHTLDGRQDGFTALAQACPTLPPMLEQSLLAELTESPADLRTQLTNRRAEDPTWQDLLAKTCKQPPGEPDPAAIATARDRATRVSCEVDRYGLLAFNDPFVHGDVLPFMLYEWLVAGRVDPPLAADVVRPLLSATASVEELEVMCRQGDLACERVYEAWGLDLPRSSTDLPLPPDLTELRITPTLISVDRAPVLTLHAGRPAPAAFVHHVSPLLHEALEARAEAGRRHAEYVEDEWDTRVMVMADRATPFSTLEGALLTATKAGFISFWLVAHDDRGPRSFPFGIPRAWLTFPEGIRFERTIDFIFHVHRDTVEMRPPGGGATTLASIGRCEPSLAGCHDIEAVTAFATRMKHSFPEETVAIYRVDGDVPLQTLVSIIDAVRGGGACDMKGSFFDGNEIPPECLFFQAVIEPATPLPEGTPTP
jgi:hypothetical protein